MNSLAKTMFLAVFIVVQQFYCIVMYNETVTVAVDMKDTTTTPADGNNTTDINTSINQTTSAENITQPPEHISAIELCNETFPTPQGKGILTQIF